MRRALVIVDLQNDFCAGGALAVPRGDEIVARVNQLVADGGFDLVVATRDWHPTDHGSFHAGGGPWPPHCLQGTPGADLHPDLDRDRIDVVLDKGQDSTTEGYSGFEDTGLAELLHEHGIDEICVAGLATDYCVKHTVRDALRLGFDVQLDTAAVRGVDVTPGDARRTLDELREEGARLLV